MSPRLVLTIKTEDQTVSVIRITRVSYSVRIYRSGKTEAIHVIGRSRAESLAITKSGIAKRLCQFCGQDLEDHCELCGAVGHWIPS